MGQTQDSTWDKTKGRGYEDGEDNKVFILASDVLHQLRQRLEDQGYRLIPTLGGKFSQHDLYQRATFSLPGLNAPEEFYYWKKTELSTELEYRLFKGRLMEAVENMDELYYDKACSMVSNILDRGYDPKTQVASIALGEYHRYGRMATLSGLPDCYKVVPPLSWFTPELQSLDCDKLLTLFPPAELSTFKMLLGRLVAGSKNVEVAEGKLNHTARSMGIIVGEDPGLGKSTMLNHITAALDVLGFSHTTINPRLGSFGWGKVAQADLSYIDDMTDSFIKAFFQESRVMSAVSNDLLTTEEKGLAATTTVSNTVILGLTNVVNYRHYLGMSPGFISRLNQLYTYKSSELTEAHPDLRDPRIRQYWDELSDRLGVPVVTLVIRLLRHCLDYFMEITGHGIVEHSIVYDKSADVLEATLSANRANYIIDVSLNHAEELTEVAGRLYALALAHMDEDEQAIALAKLEHRNFSPDVLRFTLTATLLRDSVKPEYRPYQLKYLSWDVDRYIQPKLRDLALMHEGSTLDQSFKALIGNMKSDKGFGYPESASHYQAAWDSVKRAIPGHMREVPQSKVPRALGDVLRDISNSLLN